MRTVYLLFWWCLVASTSMAQSLPARLASAVKAFEADSQMKHAIVGFCVANAKTNEIIYAHNANIGLAAASSQKVITAITAFDVLGSKYSYKTTIGYNGSVAGGVLNGDLYITGSGDPTLGSDRFAATRPELVIRNWVNKIAQAGITTITGNVYLHSPGFGLQSTPGGWIWDDIGNYYGAGHWGLNWHENQYDLILHPGSKQGEPVEIVRTEPALQNARLINKLSTGKVGSGDNAYIYLPPYSNAGFVMGTVPAGQKQFTISGSFPNPSVQLVHSLKAGLTAAGVKINGDFIDDAAAEDKIKPMGEAANILFTHQSPELDSIVFHFLRRSINLYGEALIKSIALNNKGVGDTEQGLSELFSLWQNKGVDSSAIKMADGSGLSPQNRITANAFVQVMQYAQDRPWFKSFYNALPLYNGLKMKSGTIGGVKSFTGYVNDGSGSKYTFAIIVNNYNGKASQLVSKMYKVLDVLK